VYASETQECAYAETLSYFKRQTESGPALDLSKFFDDVPRNQSDHVIEQEWAKLHHPKPGDLIKGWRDQRRRYRLRLPTEGWWVDVEHPDTMAQLSRDLAPLLAAQDVNGIDAALLRSMNRDVTIQVATWLHSRILDDGSKPVGIRYQSRHGTGTCYAIWLRRLDDGLELRQQDVQSADEHSIEKEDPDFRRVCKRFGMHPL
jgi:hypothetical protein